MGRCWQARRARQVRAPLCRLVVARLHVKHEALNADIAGVVAGHAEAALQRMEEGPQWPRLYEAWLCELERERLLGGTARGQADAVEEPIVL